MINREEYHSNFLKAEELSNKLKERIFLKTELDIVYTDITNWERNGLLEIGEGNKGDWKKLNYIEYVWLCIIADLRGFGFSYKDIIEVKKFLFHRYTAKDIFEAANQADHKRALIDELVKNENVEIPSDLDIEVSCMLELLLTSEIIQSTPISLLISKDISGLVIPISKEIINDYIHTDSIHILDTLFEGNICSISLSKITVKFFIKNNNNLSQSHLTSILSTNEKKLLKIIRKQSKTIKKITVMISEGKMDRIEVTSLKKVQLESRLLEHIKKGDYQKITIDTVDGSIVNFENTEKIKL